MTTKEKVLEILQLSNTTVSGEKMAQVLAISRTSIWKAIKELEKAGYQIQHEATGYRLVAADVLSVKEIQQALLKPEWLEEIQVFNESVSTMIDAKKVAIESNPPTALFVADTQTAAKGRFGRPFFAKPSQGLYFSLLLNPYRSFEELPQYTVIMAVAIAQAIDKIAAVATEIKWVNDIYLNGKKICGILSEAMSDVETMQISHIIIGAGINFSIPQQDFAPEVQARATSIFPDGQTDCTRNQLMAEIINQFFTLLEEPQNAIKIYREKSFVLGKKVSFVKQGTTYEGLATSITNLGELVVDVDGAAMVLSSGEISLASIER
ncbi:BirA family biotin operon repressor/biotin-[acetyl-CoA-carboxylase] ligase [Enterococcus sp. PF1-24]|uniref:biotin--[acetyl-CoA-carboxylase] ligase n=1 Tax=unclassified Enterococcus TaxID=2608891 RepID=UPI0024730065|nr:MULTISPECIES: biotin--[acetyl-CoA-carboxylase] ligase [unclassified Enterococcus]MDH6364902.1 BirA family biotin operon repressor/biotin-[acetyl-CoA-carboxylase] ligase [Enterococcus sp. PFB1-1]MDH6402003.1 BirA family biotin operon repressor/biotin-[acetyl-CoA-carboxylase] ligase [Enterococcus sp. PF1-24]